MRVTYLRLNAYTLYACLKDAQCDLHVMVPEMGAKALLATAQELRDHAQADLKRAACIEQGALSLT
jgi:hypothetical protein